MEIKSEIVDSINKNICYDELKKLAEERGLIEGKDLYTKIAKIGYVEGYNTAMGELQNKEENFDIMINEKSIRITKSQLKLLEWLRYNCILNCRFYIINNNEIEDLTK